MVITNILVSIYGEKRDFYYSLSFTFNKKKTKISINDNKSKSYDVINLKINLYPNIFFFLLKVIFLLRAI